MDHNCKQTQFQSWGFLFFFLLPPSSFGGIFYSRDNRSPQTPRDEEIEKNSQLAQRNTIAAGNPSVFLRRQLYQICGMSWMHQRTVPMVPRTFDASVILFSEDIIWIMRMIESYPANDITDCSAHTILIKMKMPGYRVDIQYNNQIRQRWASTYTEQPTHKTKN